MNLQEAYEKARKEKKNINCWTEFEKCFMFAYDDGIPHFGGDSPIIVPKDGGQCMNILYARDEGYINGEIIAEGDI